MNQQAIEDYLKTIYLLGLQESPVSTSRIANSRKVRPSSATNMIQRLDELGLVHYEKHRGVTLTDAGDKVALEMIRHHRLIELYLIEALGYDWDEVHDEAEILEHAISERLEERMAKALGYPEFDPHGEPIPAKDGTVTAVADQPLTALIPGTSAQVVRISDDTNRELLRYLDDLGVRPGVQLMVQEIAPFDGPITLTVAGDQQTIGYKAATTVRVTLQ